VSRRAIERGHRQIGTLGSGNHYLEVQVVRREGIHDAALARAFGVGEPEQVVVMFHCGSRGFGTRVATDYLQSFPATHADQWGLEVIDRELACAPFSRKRASLLRGDVLRGEHVLREPPGDPAPRARGLRRRVRAQRRALGIRTVYDVAHNTAAARTHRSGRDAREVLVHRKGATRALPPGHPELPAAYRDVGQPVIIGGSMETGSYLLAGTAGGEAAFFSTAHGSGRTMSRVKARRRESGRDVVARMAQRGILVRAASLRGIAEEAGFAYKDVDEVAAATEVAGLSRRVVHLIPVGNVKG